MFIRRVFLFIAALALLSACAPAAPTDVVEVGAETAAQTHSREAVRAELQPILWALVGGSITDQLAVIQYSQLPCANLDGLGGPPRCPEGVLEGTIMELLPILGSEGTFAKPDDMENILADLQVKNLYAVYRSMPGQIQDPNYPAGQYAMLFEPDPNESSLPIVLQVLDGKIVRIDYRFDNSAAGILGQILVEQIVIAPPEARAWSEEVRSLPVNTP